VAAALQCPDCGHQEMLDKLGGVSTFRCGGCGRALKVPAQFRDAPPQASAAPRPAPAPMPDEKTRAMPKLAPRPKPTPTPPPVTPVPGGLANAGVPTAPTPAAAGGFGAPPNEGAPPTDGEVPAPASQPESLKPPLILRLALWSIALPLGSLLTFALASAFHMLTKSQLEDTFLRADWGRFVPIARLLPFCALATALIVQLGVFGLEQLRARNLRARRSGGSGRGPGGPRPRPSRPLSPRGPAQRTTNGAPARDRAIS
jgi:hypothetical protein